MHTGTRVSWGLEANLNVGVHRNLWLNLGMDFVDAQDTELNTPLPRIPPLRRATARPPRKRMQVRGMKNNRLPNLRSAPAK
jgi:hypothetical protein